VSNSFLATNAALLILPIPKAAFTIAIKTYLKLRKINDVNKDRMKISLYLSMIAAATVSLTSKAIMNQKY